MYRIGFDVMGSDKGLETAVISGMNFLKKVKSLEIVFIGNEKEIKSTIKKYIKKDYHEYKYTILNTTEVIDMNSSFLDVRRKKDSSLVKGLELLKEKKIDGFVTGGNSASFVAASHFILDKIEGINKLAFMPTLPTFKKNKTTLILDVGANIEVNENDLYSFAKIASIYSREVKNIDNPSISLLNIGTEKSKGKELQKNTFKLLSEDGSINFYGNLEARDLTLGLVDVIVTDGFTGNIALKSIEGIAKSLFKEIKYSITKSFIRKIFALALKPAFKEISEKFDYKNQAGAILIGVDGIAFKTHGSSDIRSFESTLRMTYEAIENNVIEKIKKGING